MCLDQRVDKCDHFLQTSVEDVESRGVVSKFLASLALDIVNKIIRNLALTKDFKGIEVLPQMIHQLNVPHNHHIVSHPTFPTSSTFKCHLGIRHENFYTSLVWSKLQSVKRGDHFFRPVSVL